MTSQPTSQPAGLATGYCSEELSEVRELFETFLVNDPDYGAQVSVYRHGVNVLNLVGGAGITGDSVTGVYSCSKGMGALVMALLVQQGQLDLDALVTTYWPEFTGGGKETLLVCQLLSHQAGLVGIPEGFAPEDYNDSPAVAARLAAATPLWRPGSAFGYHALTMGVFMEELCLRITGQRLQDFYEEQIRRPSGALMFLGLPDEEDHRFRAVPVSSGGVQGFIDPYSVAGIAGNIIAGNLLELPNSRSIRAAGSASGAGVGSADGLARVYAAASTGLEGSAPLLTAETIAAMTVEQSWGWDRVFASLSAFSVVFMSSFQGRDFGSQLAFGHDGANASLGYADPAYGISFGYVPSRPEEGGTPGRAMRLSAAVRASLLKAGL